MPGTGCTGNKGTCIDAETGKKLAEEIGYPVMIKASSGAAVRECV